MLFSLDSWFVRLKCQENPTKIAHTFSVDPSLSLPVHKLERDTSGKLLTEALTFSTNSEGPHLY